jgi:hypothetical protein
MVQERNSIILMQGCNWIPYYGFMPSNYRKKLCNLFKPISDRIQIFHENVEISQNRQSYDLTVKLSAILNVNREYCGELNGSHPIKKIKDNLDSHNNGSKLRKDIALGIINDFRQLNFDLTSLITINSLSKTFPKIYFISNDLQIVPISQTSMPKLEKLINIPYIDVPMGGADIDFEKLEFWQKKRVIK